MGQLKRPLAEITTPSTAITGSTVLTLAGGGLTLRWEFDRDGFIYRAGLRFGGVRAHRHRAESYCTAWHIEGVYDTVAQIDGSEWVAELTDAQPVDRRGRFPMNHYMIYLDSAGCYEVVGADWALLPDEYVEEG
jgi:hypothetical protein